MTLDELINAMEPQARKDKALISKCVDGLTEYAAELRQKAGDAGKEQISALRRLVDELAGYWGLDAKTVDHVTAFDRKIQEVDQAVHQWTPTQEHRDAVIQGLYLYAIDMISSLGSDGARESVTECERLMREIAGFWGYESPALDDLYAQIRASLKDQEAWENTVEIGGIGENVKFLPVLKGATCGHGLEEIAEFLVSECQFDMLCVGHTIEAERIRNFGVNCDILVLGGTPFNNIPYVVENKITTTLSNADYARALSAEAVKRGTTAKVHIKINSGLGRMGAKPGGELAALLNDINGLPGIDIEGAYTHFSNSAKIDTAIIEQEAATFDSGLAQIKAAGITLKYCHAANTPATVRFPQYHYNMVRSLLLLVGYDWSVDQFNRLGLEKVLYWRGFVAQINEVKAGERFDYGLALTASRDMKVAVTSFGYSDGYPDDLPGNGGFVMIKGQKAPILSLNMDQGFVDITDIPDVCVNDQMLLIGQDGDEEVELTELLANSKHSGTYFFSLINHRVRRIFKR